VNNLKDKLPAIRKAMDAALAQVAKDHGLASLKSGSCRYDPNFGSFTFKIEGVDDGGKDKDAVNYELMKRALGLPELGTTFRANGSVCKIVGLNSTGSKVIYERDGKKWIGKVDDVKRTVERQALAAAAMKREAA
jgi:hypothetical protein